MTLKIGIIGAGTAGLATAIAFAQRGHQVHVLEKHPSVTTLGAGLLIQPQGVLALHQLGLGAEFDAASVPIDHLLGLTHRNWTIVDVPYRRLPARAVSRAALAGVLWDAAKAAQVDLRFGSDVSAIRCDGATAVVTTADDTLAYDLLVIANGAASVLPQQAGMAVATAPYSWGALWGMFDVADWHAEQRLEQRYRGTARMFGLMPTAWIGDKLRLSLFWSLPRSDYDAWLAGSIDTWKAELLELWPESAPVVHQINSHEQLTFASYCHARPHSLANPPICIVGDAGHAMSPQLGLGATLAVQDALALAATVDLHGPARGPLAYAKQRLPTVRAYQFLSRALTPCFQAQGNGWWRDAIFGGGLFVPGVRSLMYRSIA